MDHTIVHFEIPASNIQILKKFYENLFNWKITNSPAGDMDYWIIHTVPTDENGMLQRPGVNGGLLPKQPDQKDSAPVNYILVENIDEYITKVTNLGGKILIPKQTVTGVGYVALASDPEGNRFGMLQPETP